MVKATIGQGVEEEDKEADVDPGRGEHVEKGSVETARAIYAHMLAAFPGKKSVWMLAAQLEKQHGSTSLV